jgi:hypothetical protein
MRLEGYRYKYDPNTGVHQLITQHGTFSSPISRESVVSQAQHAAMVRDRREKQRQILSSRQDRRTMASRIGRILDVHG